MPTTVAPINGHVNGEVPVKRAKNGLVDVVTNDPVVIWDKKVPNTELERFQRQVEKKYNMHFGSIWEFHKWSVDHFGEFWAELWEFYDVVSSTPYTKGFAKTGPGFLDNEWFPGAKLNYAENMLRIRDDRLALVYIDELGNEEKLSYAQLYEEVKRYAAAFRHHGLQNGDRVACYMSNRKEAVIAMLAAVSIGAMWGGPVPYYGARAASNIIKMMEPKFIIAVDHHIDNGNHFNTFDNLATIASCCDSIEKVIIVPTLEETLSKDISSIPHSVFLEPFLESAKLPSGTYPELKFEQLPFNHPAFINFTSGTTGLPKGPVHAGGVFLGNLRDFGLHLNLVPGDAVLLAFPVGWSLWDYFIPCLAMGVTVVLYAGSLYYNKDDVNVWNLMSKYQVGFTMLVSSIVDYMEKNNVVPSPDANLDRLKVVGIGGSPVKKQNLEFLQSKVKKDMFVGSMYGSTEAFSAFSGFDMNTISYAGEIQMPGLGIDIQCYNQHGQPVIGERGELVVQKPFPTLPLHLWKDTNNARLKDIYFSKYPGVWTQNDECWINPKTNGIIVIGRSDDTLKQNGERFGPGDIYFAVHNMEELQDYICVGQDGQNGDTRAVLFVKLKKGYTFTQDLREKIAQTVSKELWADYVPQAIVEVKDIPYNLNNKRMESVVRKIVATNKIPELSNIKNPESLKYFCNIPEVMNYQQY